MEKLRAYISMVKDRFNPTLSDDAASLLEKHYECCRMSESATIPVTVRFLESMIRLSQAHARLMYRNVVILQDAIAVLRVMECSAFTYGGFDGNVQDIENIMYCDPMSMEFSNQADIDFLCFQYRVLKRYDMLVRLSLEHQNVALAYMGQSENGGTADHGVWSQMENPRERHQNQQIAATSPWGVESDHYGRLHFSQAQGSPFPNYGQNANQHQESGSSHNKRRRM